jgi:hypothetical protein
MIKVTKETEIISSVGQASIKAGVSPRGCDDICSDQCVINCGGSGSLNWDNAADWIYFGVWGKEDPV